MRIKSTGMMTALMVIFGLAGVANAQSTVTPRLVGTVTVRTTPVWVSPPGQNFDGKLPPPSIKCEKGFKPGEQRTPSAKIGWNISMQRDLEERTARAIAPEGWNGEFYIVNYTTPIRGSIALFCLTDRDIVGNVTPPTPEASTEPPSSTPTCKDTEELIDGKCVAPTPTCKDNEQMSPDGKTCVAKPTSLACAAPKVLNDKKDACIDPLVAKTPTAKPPLYKRPALWWTVGSIVGAGIIVGTVVALTRPDRGTVFEGAPRPLLTF